MNTIIEKIGTLYKVEHNEAKTLEMLGIEGSKAIAYAYLTEKYAIDYIEFLDHTGTLFKCQVNITRLKGVGIDDAESLEVFKSKIVADYGYYIADPSEVPTLAEKISVFVNILGS